MTIARSVQRVPLDQRWKAQGLEGMNVPCQQLHERRAAIAVQVEEFAEDPNAKPHGVGSPDPQSMYLRR